ncbi:MAG: hypothetical protein JJT93_07265 [Gammaproteobacteria bacterium]|nr:hypothetical protein [Gammaproteobacteria bacterium]
MLRTLLLASAATLAAVVLLAAWWLFDHARPRHDHFVERKGQIVEVRAAPSVQETGRYTSQGVRLVADTGLTVDLRVLRPSEDNGPLPLMVVLGGHRTGQDAVDLVGDPGNVVVAALDYPYDGPTRIRNLRQFIPALRLMQQGLLDTPPAVSLALDWLMTQAYVDTSQVELVGVSLGTPFVAVAGALDQRFARVWIIHGGAGNEGWIEYNLGSRVPSTFWRPHMARLLHLLAYGPSFDTKAWVAQIAPRPLIVIGATDDERLPRHKVEQLHAAAGEPRELIWTEGAHVDPRRPDIVQELLAIVRQRMDARPPVQAERDEDQGLTAAQAGR